MLFPSQIPILYNAQIKEALSHHLQETLHLNNALLICISADPEILFTKLIALHLTQELLVVSDDDQLEVRLVTSVLDDLIQGLSESSNIVLIKIRCGLIKSNDLFTISTVLLTTI